MPAMRESHPRHQIVGQPELPSRHAVVDPVETRPDLFQKARFAQCLAKADSISCHCPAIVCSFSPTLCKRRKLSSLPQSEPTSSAGACPFQRKQRGRPQISTRKRPKVYEWNPASCSITPVYATTREASGNCWFCISMLVLIQQN